MANKEDLKVNIEAVDNFSKVINELLKKLSQIERKQGKIDPSVNVSSINTGMKKLNDQLEKLQSDNIVKLTGDKIKKEIDSAIKQAKSLIEKSNNALNNLNSKTVNKGKNFNSAYKDFIEDYSGEAIKALKKNKDLLVGAKLDKGSIDKVQKEAQDAINDKKPVKKKVNLVSEDDKSNYGKIPVKLDTTKVKEDIKKIQEIVDSKPITQKVKLVTQEESKNKDNNTTKKNTTKQDKPEDVSKKIKNKVESSGIEIKPTINEKVVKALGKELADSIKREVKNIDLDAIKLKLKSSVDDKFLNKSLLDVISKINEKPFKIKVGKDEKYFNKVIDDNIKKASKKVVNIKATIDNINYDKSSLRSFDKVQAIKALIDNIKFESGKVKEFRDNNIINLNAVIKSIKFDKDALQKIKSSEISLNGSVKGSEERGKKSGSQSGNDIIKDVRDEFKTLQQQRNKAVVDMDKAYQQYGKNSDEFKNAKLDYKQLQNALTDFQLSAGVGGNIQSVINDLKRQYASYKDNEPIKNVIREELEKAYARRDKIDKELKNIDPAEGDKAYNAFIRQLDSMIRAMAKHEAQLENLTRKAQERDRKQSEQGRAAVIKEGYASDAHNTQLLELERRAKNKAIKEQADDEVQQQKLLNDYLKAQEKLQDAIIRKSQQEEIEAQKLVNLYQKMLEARAKDAAGWNRAERQRDNIISNRDRADLKADLQRQSTSALGAGLDSSQLNKFLADIEKYRAMTNDVSSNFYKKMGQQLGIGEEHPYFETLRRLHQQMKEAERAWNQSEKNKENATKTSANNIKSTYQTLAQQAAQYAREAEKAWRMSGGVSTPVFEDLKHQFMGAMENLVNFRRSLGNLSAGAEANIFSNMARSISNTNPLYDSLIQRVRRLRQEQQALRNSTSPSGGGSGSGNIGGLQMFSNVVNGIIQFLGRASKGFGSFLEAVSKANLAIARLGQVGLVVSGILGAIGAAVASVTTIITTVSNSVQMFGEILMQVGSAIYNALKPGIELYKQQQSAIFSFTAALQSNGVLKDGSRLDRDQARGLSRELIARAELDAELSAFNLDELLRSLQGTLPILMQHGMSVEQAYEVNKGVASVAKLTQLSPNQILQEVRDLAQGSITARTSQVANALGITNEDIAKYKGNADELFEYLMGKFENYSDMMQEYEDTAIGRWQQLQEIYQKAASVIVEEIAPMFKGFFEYLINLTGQWEDKTGAYLDALTGRWHRYNEETGQVEDLDKVDEDGKVVEKYEPNEAFFNLSEEGDKIKDALIEIIEYIAQIIDGTIEWAGELMGTNDPIDTAKEIIKNIINMFVIGLKILGEIFGVFLDIGDAVLSILKISVDLTTSIMAFWYGCKAVLNIVLLIGKGIANIVLGIYEAAKGWQAFKKGDFSALEKGIQKGIDTFWDNTSKDWDDFKKGIEDDGKNLYQAQVTLNKLNGVDSFSDFFDGVGATLKKGDFYSAVTKYTKDYDKDRRGDSKGAKLGDVRGVPRESDKDAAKAQKQAIKDSQKALKEHIKGLKEALKDHIDELKEIQEERDIAYKEGFTSIKDYYTQKAESEAKEARLRLEEAQKELVELESAKFENEYDRSKELHSVKREIRKYSRAVEKTTRQQAELARNVRNWTNQQGRIFNTFVNMVNNGSVLQKQTGGVTSGGSNTSTFSGDLMQYNPQTFDEKVSWAMQMAMKKGFDKAAAAGIVGNWIYESGGRLDPNALGDNGTSYGIAQWHNERWDSLKTWAEKNNSDWHDYRTQVLFGLDELINGSESGRYYANNGDVDQQVVNFMNKIERPAEWAKAQSRDDRIEAGRKAFSLADKLNFSTSSNVQAVSTGQKIVDNIGNLIAYNAYDYVKRGVPYVWGGADQNGVDCSGLVYSVYRSLGIEIERTADEQADQMKDQGGFFEDAAKLMVGDLVFMRGSDPGSNGVGHVGIYAGDGKYVHAPGSGKNVQYANLSDRRDIVGYGSVRVLTGQFKDLGEQTGELTSNISNLASSVQKVSSLIAGAVSVLVDANGEIIGYTPEEQYSRGGIDTRYSTFQEGMSGGVDAQIAGLKDEVKQSINIIAKEFFEQTGQKIEWSSFTGGKHQGGPFSHAAGWKADANIDSDFYDLLKKIVTKHGVAAGAEWIGTDNQHVDFSWAGGGIGGPNEGGKYLTSYTTGEQFYNRSRNATTQLEVVAQNLDDAVTTFINDEGKTIEDRLANIKQIMGSIGIYNIDIPNTTKLAHEFFEEGKKANTEFANLAEEYSSRVFGNVNGRILKLIVDFDNDISKHRSGSAEDNRYIEVAYKSFEAKLSDLLKNNYEDILEFNLNEIERNSKFRATDIYTGKYSFGSLVDTYSSYFTDPTNPNGLAYSIQELEKLAVKYTNNGFLKEATDIRNRIEDAKKSLYDMFNSWIEQGQKYWDNAEAIFEASNRFSPTQREHAEREFKAYRAQREYDDRTKLAIQYGNEYRSNLAQIEALRKATAGLAKDSKTYNDNMNEIDRLAKRNSMVEEYALANEQLRKLADLTRKMPDDLEDIGRASRDALDEGLVEFLTDGILEAESLGDALRDLAKNVLKAIQRESAKQIVRGIMNGLFGRFHPEKEVPVTVPYLQQINATLTTGFNTLANILQGNQINGSNNLLLPKEPMTVQEKWLKESGNLGLGKFSKPWEESPLNPNAKKLEYSFDKDKFDLGKAIDDKFSNNIKGTVSEGFDLTANKIDTFSRKNENILTATKTIENIHKVQDKIDDTIRKNDDNVRNEKLGEIANNTSQKNQQGSYENGVDAKGSNSGLVSNSGTGSTNGLGGGAFGSGFTSGGYTGAGVTGKWGIGSKLGGAMSNILKPVTNLVNSVAGEVADFLNSDMFGGLLNSVNGILGSAGTQLAGTGFAISTLINGDTKEKLLSMIFIELQLIYQQLASISSFILGGMQGMMPGMTIPGTVQGAGNSMYGGGVPVTPGAFWSGLGVFSNPWSTSPLNSSYQPLGQTTQSYNFDGFSQGLENFGARLNEVSDNNLLGFGEDISNTALDVKNSLDSSSFIDPMQNAMSQSSVQVQESINMLVGQINSGGNILFNAIQNLATRISSIPLPGFGGIGHAATGGYVYHNKILKLAKGGTVYNNNGLINGPGTSTSDSIPAMLSNGEAVLNAKAVKRLGINFISAVNNGNFTKIKANIPHFADGGVIGDAYQSTARGMTDFANNIGTNVSTTNHMNVALVRDEREAMEHFMKSPRGQRILVDFQKGSGRVFSRFGKI